MSLRRPQLTLPLRSATHRTPATLTLLTAPPRRTLCLSPYSRRSSERSLPPAARPRLVPTTSPLNSTAAMTSIANSDIALDAGIDNTDTMTLDNYKFPAERLKKQLSNDEKTPIVLVSCGSFSPPTNL